MIVMNNFLNNFLNKLAWSIILFGVAVITAVLLTGIYILITNWPLMVLVVGVLTSAIVWALYRLGWDF
jgi:hypothetical protein